MSAFVFPETEQIILAITPKCTSFLSIIGSSYIIFHCIRFQKKSDYQQRGFDTAVYNRLLFALSTCDLMSSFSFFMSTWALPRSYDDLNMPIYNIGSTHTCKMQGFTLQFGFLGVVLYNTCLSVHFLLFIREKVTNRDGQNLTMMIHKRRATEIIFHSISLIIPMFTAAYSVQKDYINPTYSFCWISEYPDGCIGDECIRGEKSQILRIFFLQIPIGICTIIVIYSMVKLHRYVKLFEETTFRRSNLVRMGRSTTEIDTEENTKTQTDDIEDGTEQTDQNRVTTSPSQKVYNLALRYVLALLTVWVPTMIQTIYTKFFVDNIHFAFVSGFIFSVFAPLQGFFNALIYRGFNPLGFLLHHFFCMRSNQREALPIKNESYGHECLSDSYW